MSTVRALTTLAAAILALTVAAPTAAAARPAARTPAVIVDADMDFDDTVALAYLAEADRIGLIDLRAVTVAVDGVAFAGNGLSHARCLLGKVGMSGVPTSDGDRLRTNNFPDLVRTLLDGVVDRALAPCPPVATEGHAARLLTASIRAARRPVTLVTLGPLTNVAQALERDPAIARKIARVVAVGGDTTGLPPDNPSDTHDFNLWVDAPAAQAVLRALPGRVFLSARNASDHVPLTASFRARLAADRTTPAADLAYSIASDPLILTGEQGATPGGAFWWDPLAAVAATVGGVETFQLMRISIVQSGTDEGSTVIDPRGSPVHMGVSASADRFHDVLIAVLNDRR
jgi:inosine-uridine nucleoside N-ribohydrolase